MNWRFLVVCGLAGTVFSPLASAQLGNGGFNFNRVTDNTYYYGAEVSEETNEFFVRNRYQDVNTRWQRGFNPLSVRLGAFEALPSLTGIVRATDNLFLDDLNSVTDVGFGIEPSVTVQSTWSRHKIGFDGRVRHTQFVDSRDETATVGGARAFGILDVTSNFAIGASGSFENRREPRVSFGGALGTTERVSVDRFGGEGNLLYRRNRVRLSARGSYTEFDYSDVEQVDGSIADQDFRDFDEFRTAARGDFAISRDWALVGEVEYVDRDNDDSLGLLDRSISGVAIRAGTNFELPFQVRGDILVGFQTFDSANPLLDDINEVAVRAEVFWFPSELTTVRVTAGRDVEDPGAVDASTLLVTRVNGQITQELRRNLLAYLRGGFRDLDFSPTPLEETEFSVGVGGTWKLNENFHLTLGYDFRDRDSTVQPFSENSGTLTLRFFP